MNQRYLEWYEFDAKVVCIVIPNCTKEINVIASMNESECSQISILLTHLYSNIS